MPLKDLLQKKDKLANTAAPEATQEPQASEFQFLRSDTNTVEPLQLPTYPGDTSTADQQAQHARGTKSLSIEGLRDHGRLAHRLHLRSHSRHSSQGSINIPEDLPEIDSIAIGDGNEDGQAKWEERATLLAERNPNASYAGGIGGSGSRPSSRGSAKSSKSTGQSKFDILKRGHHDAALQQHLDERTLDQPNPKGGTDKNNNDAAVNSKDDIQTAISLHESGDLVASTAMFGRLARHRTPNPMAQILYGLALRHGWGIDQDSALAVRHLSDAAASSATIENEALQHGVKKGGAAKGELVLAIYELANSFRHGWGVQTDPVAARKYYEVAANLGDTDAMNETARCYEEGYGGKKDRFTAAQYYRLAETHGSKTLGNSWIWKDKYSPPSTLPAATSTSKKL